jgi:phosphoribosylaminoimidazole-succinocarboxamide synthase
MSIVTSTNLSDRFHQGKVRDTYLVGESHLLMIATDRVSAFDIVLPTPIPEKGAILAQLSAFWFHLTRHISNNHMVALASDPEFPDPLGQHKIFSELDGDLRRRSMLVKKAQRIDVECIVRGYLAGSAWAEYQTHGTIGQSPAPENLLEGSKLEVPLFTPTTKAEEGHDEPMTLREMEDLIGGKLTETLEATTLRIYRFAEIYAASRGIIIADTKMEFGFVGDELILIDELLTPDSSRFWDQVHYEPGHAQPNFDKQFIRDWLTDSGWNREPPAPELPSDVVVITQNRYLEAFQRLTGRKNID